MCVFYIECTVLAIDIFNTHHPLLSQSLSDPVSVAIMLQREGVITGQVLASVVLASPSVPNQREVLLAAIIVAIQSQYSLLQTFASVLCKFTGNVKLGTAIQRDYGNQDIKYYWYNMCNMVDIIGLAHALHRRGLGIYIDFINT